MSSLTAVCTRCGTPLDSLNLNGLCPRCVALDVFAPAPPEESAGTALLGEGERRMGDYELLEEIGRGGMGLVYRARQLSLGREVAVKMLLHGVLAGDAAIARLKAEATAVAKLRHPNIVAVHEVGEFRGRHFFSMEFVRGRTLAEKAREGPMPAKLAATYLQRVAEAIHYAHERGVLHRDLKPSNVLVDENDQPRVTDFGLAKHAGAAADLTMTGQVLGTPAYMPPEQAGGTGFGPVDARSDIYSLGAVLYHLVTGRPPFTGETITEILRQVTDSEPVAPRLLNPKLPRDLETICLKCLAKEPARRYARAQALADELGRFLRDEPVQARPAGATEKLWRWCRRKPALATALGACAAILLAGAAGILWQLKQTEAAQRQAVQEAKKEAVQRQLAEQARQQAEASALVTRQNLYAADMLEAQRAVERDDFGTTRMLLDAYRPKPGEADLRGFEWRHLWAGSRGDDSVVLTNGGNVGAVEFSPDGKWLAMTGTRVLVWDTTTWRVRAQAEIHASTAAFFTNSASLAIGVWGPWSVKRWDWLQPGGPQDFINSDGSWPYAVVSPAGDFAAVGYDSGPGPSGPEGSATVFDANGKWLRVLPESGGRVAFSADGKLLATGSWKGKIKLWDPATGALVRTLDNANQATVLAFSPDGRTLAVCAPLTDGAWLYDVATGAQRPFARGNFCCVWGAAFSPDNATLATAVTDGTVRLWDVASGKQTACLRGHRGAVGRVAWSPDGTLLASGGTDGMVRIWKVAKAANAEPPPKMVAGEIKRACLSRDGKWIVVTEPGGAASLHQWPSLGLVGTPRQIGEPLGFAPDATAVLSLRSPTNRDVTAVAWWGVPGLNLLKETTLSQNVSPEMACEVSPDGRWLAAGGKRNQLRVFDLADQGKLFADTTESLQDDGAASILAFSPNSRVLAASFTRSAPVYLWEPASTNGLFGFKGHASQALGLVFTSEGRTLLSGADTIRLWDVAGRGKLDSLPRASLNAAHGMDLSPDGKTLATTRDWEVQLWNLATHRQVGRFPTTGTVSALAFAPDGNGLFITTQSTNGPQTSIERAPGFAETDAPGAP